MDSNEDDNLESEFDLSEFGLENNEVLNVRKMTEKNNLSILSRRLKNIDGSMQKMDDALIEIIWNLDNIIEDSEKQNGLFQNDCQEAIEKILELVEVSHTMFNSFEKMKKLKEKISQLK